jgi:hypothetical protein
MSEEEFMSDDERETWRRLKLLKAQAERGNFFADWIRAPAGVLFLEMLEGKIQDAKNAWLSASDRDAAEIVRVQSQVYLKIKQWLAAQVQSGKVAQAGIAQFEEEGTVLSNLSKQPQGPEPHFGQAKEIL